jgi:serine/threonine protein kinase/formylglycine-generating enzyme required for sulfatase activity
METKSGEFDSLFIKNALQQKVVSPDQMEECLLVQRREAKSGRKYSIGQILIKRRYISCADFLTIQNNLERKVYECNTCKTRYRARELKNGAITCRGCGQMVGIIGPRSFASAEILASHNPDALTISMDPVSGQPQSASNASGHISANGNGSSNGHGEPAPTPAPSPASGAPETGSKPQWGAPRSQASAVVPVVPTAKPVPESAPVPVLAPAVLSPAPSAAAPKAPKKGAARYRPALDFTEESLNALDRYEIIEELGRGGMGIVFKAFQPDMDRVCALKVITTSPEVSPAQINRFVQEGRSAAQLHHPNIIRVFDCGQQRNFFYIAMEFLEGKPLNEFMKEQKPGIEQILKVFDELLDAVEFAHQHGVVHRDLKPQNIMVEDVSNRAKLIDFGLAKDFTHGMELTQPGQILGSPFYLSPEQTRGESYKVDGRSDVFALGVILYELTTGSRPFAGKSAPEVYAKILNSNPVPPMALNPEIDQELQDIILDALEKEVEERFQSAQEMRDCLTDYRDFLKGRSSALKYREERKSRRESKSRRRELTNNSSQRVRKTLLNQRNSQRFSSTQRGRAIGVKSSTGTGSFDRRGIRPRERGVIGRNTRSGNDASKGWLVAIVVIVVAGILGLAAMFNKPQPKAAPDITKPLVVVPSPNIITDEPPKPIPPVQKSMEARAEEALAEISKLFDSEDGHDYGDTSYRLKEFTSKYSSTKANSKALKLQNHVLKEADIEYAEVKKKTKALALERKISRAELLIDELLERVKETPWEKKLKSLRLEIKKDFEIHLTTEIAKARGLIDKKKLDGALKALGDLYPSNDENFDKEISGLIAQIKKLKKAEKPVVVVDENLERDKKATEVLTKAKELIKKHEFANAIAIIKTLKGGQYKKVIVDQLTATVEEANALDQFVSLIKALGPKLKGLTLTIHGFKGRISEADNKKIVIKANSGGSVDQEIDKVAPKDMLTLFSRCPLNDKPKGALLKGIFSLHYKLYSQAVEFLKEAKKRSLKVEPYYARALAKARTVSTPKDKKKNTGKKGPIVKALSKDAFVPVANGPFILGTNSGYVGTVPARTVTLSSYRIMKYEVSVAQYKAFLATLAKLPDDKRHKHCHPLEGVDKDHSPDNFNNPAYANLFKDDHPISFVDWYDAYSFARFYNCRLPTEAEWEKAARGPDGKAYPWGEQWDRTRVVSGPYWLDQDMANPDSLTELRAFRAAFATKLGAKAPTQPVNSMTKGRSVYGAQNMIGNVHEWVMDFYHAEIYQTDKTTMNNTNPEGPAMGSKRSVRGGHFFEFRPNLFHAYYRRELKPTTRQAQLGFRVIKPMHAYKLHNGR